MKKNLLLFLWLIALLFTSCISGTEDKVTYFRNGVALLEPIPCIYTGDSLIITAAELDTVENLQNDDCFQVEFRTAMDETIQKNIYSAEILRLDPVEQWPLHSELTDTTILLEKEQMIVPAIRKTQILKKKLFLQTELSNYRAQQTDNYDLSYNSKEVIEENEDGRKIYDLFLRSTKEAEGDTIQKKWIQTNAFRIDSLIDNAIASGLDIQRDSLHIRLNYGQRYNADTTKFIWTSSSLYSVPLSEIY